MLHPPLELEGLHRPHGPAPSLAFRIEYKGKSVAYSGDTTSLSANGNMIEIARDADLLKTQFRAALLDPGSEGGRLAGFSRCHRMSQVRP